MKRNQLPAPHAWKPWSLVSEALFIIASIGVVLIYLAAGFHSTSSPRVLLALVGILGMIVFGYGIYRGRINLQKSDRWFQSRVTILNWYF